MGMSNVKTQMEQVAKFMKVGGQEVNHSPTFASYATAKLRYNLIVEEIVGRNEFQYCAERDDLVGALDGLCDILYVTYGAALTYGTAINCNLFAPSTVGGRHATAHHTVKTINGLILDAERFHKAFEQGHIGIIQESLTDIVTHVYEYASAISVDLAGAFDEVHQSNMSKFSETEEHAQHSIDQRKIQGDEKYSNAYTTSVEVDGKTVWMIKRKEDGKILKSLNFFEPNLSKFVK